MPMLMLHRDWMSRLTVLKGYLHVYQAWNALQLLICKCFAAVTHFGEKFKLAIIVCLIDVLESISIAKALAYKHKYELMYVLGAVSAAVMHYPLFYNVS